MKIENEILSAFDLMKCKAPFLNLESISNIKALSICIFSGDRLFYLTFNPVCRVTPN
jgi:hypothetical protein